MMSIYQHVQDALTATLRLAMCTGGLARWQPSIDKAMTYTNFDDKLRALAEVQIIMIGAKEKTALNPLAVDKEAV